MAGIRKVGRQVTVVAFFSQIIWLLVILNF